MDVAESPDQDPRSPEAEEEPPCLSDDDILRESGSEPDADGAAGRASDLDEESRSEEDQDSEAQEQSRGPGSPPRVQEGDPGEEDEASSVTRELDEHELDYDEEVPEEPAPVVQEEEAEDRGDSAPGEQGPAAAPDTAEQEPTEVDKEKKKEDDDGEIDDGEIDDDDLEEGEVKDPSDRKVRPRPTCRFFMKGNCTWGMNCRFIHPGVNDKGNYSLISKAEPFPPNGAPPLGPHPLMPANPWGGPVVDEILPPPPPEPPTESAWERGLRHAKEVLKKATIRKEQEPDFEEKRLTVTIGEDERGFDKENEAVRDWACRLSRDTRDPVLEPYADPYYDYEVERFWRGGQYENFRVQYTEAEPYHTYRERERERERDTRQRERERERERDKERQRRKEEWERERAKRDEKDRQHRERERDKDREKEKEKPKARSPQPPSRQAEPPKKEAASTGPQVKRADEWKDPWRRSKSPKKKLGVSVSPSRARRRRRTSASSASASNSSRSSSRSSSYSGSGSSRSRSSSYSSYSSRSSRRSSFSGSRSRSRSFSSSPSPSPTPSPHRPSVRAKGEPAPPPGKAGEKSVKKPAPPAAPLQVPKTSAPAPEPPKAGDPRAPRRKERQARSPPRRRTVSGSGSSYSGSSSRSRSLSVSSVSSASSGTSSSSSVHSVDSDDMYADLASPVSSASSRSPTPAQPRKDKGKSKKEDGTKEDKRKRDPSAQASKSSRPGAGGRASQQPSAAQQTSPGQTQQSAFVAHKEIKLTLLNKATEKGGRKRYEPSDKDRQSPPAKRANVSPERGSRDRKSSGRLGSPKPERQRGQNSKAPQALADRKRQLSPQSKSSSKVTSVPGKASEGGAATGGPGPKGGKASTLSRREELLKQLKAVEDAIARKRAKIPGKV